MKQTALAILLLGTVLHAAAADRPLPAVAASGVPAFSDAMLAPEYWIRRAPAPDAVLLSAGEVAQRRAAAYGPGGGYIDVAQLPATLTRAQVAAWIVQAQKTPVKLAVY